MIRRPHGQLNQVLDLRDGGQSYLTIGYNLH